MGLLPGQLFIAEVKVKTPFDRDWKPEESYQERLELAVQYGDWLSIHTDERWGGSFEKLTEARALVGSDKTILAKGFHQSDKQIERALDHGADYVLTVDYESEAYADLCLLEPYTVYQLAKLGTERRAVWNARNPHNGDDKIDDFERARQAWPDGWLCQASLIQGGPDVHPEADAVLVGTHLPAFIDSIQSGGLL